MYKLNLLCDAIIHSQWEQEPNYYNQIFLSASSKDNYGLPRVEIKNKYSSLTYKTIKLSMENLGRYFIQSEAGRIKLENFFLNESEFSKKPNEGGHHHMGGTIMGNDINKSVVDSNLKVHNISNLFVAGSSVFPTGVA
jgi:choline dehydrogenase-like flavoprotein